MKKDYAWLNRWEQELRSIDGTSVLELGCGDAIDSKVIGELCRSVISTDIRADVIDKNRASSNIEFRVVDLSKPLPFKDESFSCVVAGLCLHYFTWRKTLDIVSEISRISRDGGLFVGRVNSTRDTNWGSNGYHEIESGLYDVEGKTKRFFTKQAVEAMLTPKWEIESLIECAIDRYEKSKVVWQFSARKKHNE